MGFDRQMAIRALKENEGDVDMAASALFSSPQ